MNKTEVILNVSEKSGVKPDDTRKVLEAFEEVFNERLSNSKGINCAFDKVYSIMSFIKNKKDNNQKS